MRFLPRRRKTGAARRVGAPQALAACRSREHRRIGRAAEPTVPGNAVDFAPDSRTRARPLAVTRPCRAFLAALFSLLLLGMQSEGLRHSLVHRAAALTAPDGQSLQLPNDAPCVECRLIAGGINVIAGAMQAMHAVSILPLRLTSLPRSTPQSAPSYDRSRAPPPLH